jgi:hypothetical protein
MTMESCKNCYYRDKELNPCIKCKCGDKFKDNITNYDKIREADLDQIVEYFLDQNLLKFVSKFYCKNMCKYRIDGKCDEPDKCPDDRTILTEYLKSETE